MRHVGDAPCWEERLLKSAAALRAVALPPHFGICFLATGWLRRVWICLLVWAPCAGLAALMGRISKKLRSLHTKQLLRYRAMGLDRHPCGSVTAWTMSSAIYVVALTKEMRQQRRRTEWLCSQLERRLGASSALTEHSGDAM